MAKEKFDLTKLLGNRKPIVSAEPAKTTSEETTGAGINTVLISIYDLEPSKKNFYKVDDVQDLKDSIEMFGVKQNLIVQQIPGATNYEIIAGHRRREASRLLVEEGKTQFEYLPCHVETNLSETEKGLLLILTNLPNRKLSPWEEVEQVTQLKPLLKEYKKTNNVPGRLQELIAEAMNISKSQVERIETISKNLSDDFKEELKNDRITFSAASELARLSPADQAAVYENHKETGTTTLNQVREKKESIQPAEQSGEEKENPTVRALLIAKAVLCKEAEKVRLTGINDPEIIREYRILMNRKVREVEKELKKLMGYDMFKAGDWERVQGQREISPISELKAGAEQ